MYPLLMRTIYEKNIQQNKNHTRLAVQSNKIVEQHEQNNVVYQKKKHSMC